MSRYLKDLHRTFKIKLQRVFFKGGEQRQLQEQYDIHKLFLFTSYHAQQQQLEQVLRDELAAHLIEQGKATPFEQQRQVVQHNLHGQLVKIGRCIHTCLAQQQDRMPAATALDSSWHKLQQQQQQQQGLQKQPDQQQQPAGSSSSSTVSVADQDTQQQQQQQQKEKADKIAQSSKQLISQAQLSQLLQQQLGYSLSVRPSKITHEEAGLGLFVEGEVPPGALVALFPGLAYSKDVHRRMPGYPRMDIGNPYLTARYDGRIVDSLPWGRGLLADGSMPNVAVAPRPLGLIGRMAAASDGPRNPIPDTLWVRATTAEAAALEMLEGRHPLAMAHYANHPSPGTAPNVMIASFTFRPPGCKTGGADSSSSSSSSGGGSSEGEVEPWMRAYVPNIDYSYSCSQQDLLTQEVHCVGLVSVSTLPAGTEVLFNYRLSPSLLGRPKWYVPVNSKEENMRWA